MMGKRILIILVVLILIFVAVVLFFIFSKKSNTQNGAVDALPILLQESNLKNGLPQDTIKKENFPDYSIGVPENMSSELLPNTSGGSTLVIKPKGDDPNNTSITVQQTDSSLSSFERQSGIFKALGHSSTNISLGGVDAVKYVNQLPGRDGKNLYETVVLFQKGSIVYQIRLAYEGLNPDQNLNAVFDTVLANFSAN